MAWSSSPGQGLGRGGQAQEGQVGAQRLILEFSLMPRPLASVVAREGEGDDLGHGVEVDARLAPRIGPSRRARSARAAAQEACWPCGHRAGRVLNWAEHDRFEGGSVLGGAHHRPPRRRAPMRCETSSMPAGEKTSRLPCRAGAAASLDAAEPRRHRVAVAPEGHARLVVDDACAPRWSPGRERPAGPSAPRPRPARRRSATSAAPCSSVSSPGSR